MKTNTVTFMFFMFSVFCFTSTFAAANSSDWPQTIKTDNNVITLYQPQLKKLEKDTLSFTLAVGVNQSGKNVFGKALVQCKTTIDKNDGSASCTDVTVGESDFPNSDNSKDLSKLVNQALSQQSFQFSSDELKSSLKLSQIDQLKSKTPPVENKAPKIYVADSPSALVTIDGDPQLRKIPGHPSLMRVINTPYVIVLDSQANVYYLQAGGTWMKSDKLNGTWTEASEIPSAIQDLEKNSTATGNDTYNGAPNIIISTVPAALLQTEGKPEFSPIADTGLMYVSNSDNDIFYLIKSQIYYALISGRWFKADDLTSDATWTYVSPDDLPADFGSIPEDTPKANVLASVPDTDKSQAALSANETPQTAKISRSQAKTSVTYEGKPQFTGIHGTRMKYATNTRSTVIFANNQYYDLVNGIWFVSDSPLGPWVPADQIPDVIYTIPPDVPVYPATFVYVYDATPDFIYLAYTAGYLSSFIDNGLVVFGTGFLYPPFINDVYFGGPFTYGFDLGYLFPYWAIVDPFLNPFWFGYGLSPDDFINALLNGYFGEPALALFLALDTFNNLNIPDAFPNVYDRWTDKVVITQGANNFHGTQEKIPLIDKTKKKTTETKKTAEKPKPPCEEKMVPVVHKPKKEPKPKSECTIPVVTPVPEATGTTTPVVHTHHKPVHKKTTPKPVHKKHVHYVPAPQPQYYPQPQYAPQPTIHVNFGPSCGGYYGHHYGGGGYFGGYHGHHGGGGGGGYFGGHHDHCH